MRRWSVVLAGSILLSSGVMSYPGLAGGFVESQTSQSVGSTTAGVLSTTSGSSAASSCTASGSSSSSSSSSSGGLSGVLSGLTDSLQGILGPIQTLINQASCLRDSVLSRVEDSLGNIGNTVGGIQGTIDEAMGALNLLDPDKFLNAVLSRMEGGSGQNADELPVTQINAVLQGETLRTVGNVENARSDSASVLSSDAQTSMQSQFSSLQQQVQDGAQQAQASVGLAEQAMAIVGGTDGGATTAQGLANQSTQLAQQAQSRVSTQDAIKDLNTINANISTQMSQLAGQNGIQSQQLSQMSTQNAIGLQLDAAQVGRLNQTVTGIAVANQTLADMNERALGDRQAGFIEQSADTNRLNMLNATGYRLAP